jgi:DNA repair protein SbcC/Rad50
MKEVGKKYPRIYSISTVGIRNHNNADYLIHPLRTDFTGESTTGKSLVGADLPQLILTAGKYYKSATPPKGGVQRECNTLPLPNLSFAYTFLNIEIDPQKFIVIGVQIKNSRKILIPFIIQGEKYLGYETKETNKFKALDKVIRFKDFLIGRTEMPTIENLKDHLDKHGFFLKSFYHNESDYHKLLFDNEILHLDLSKDEKLQRQFANTLQSLSRGEDIETSGTKFKKFLFHYDNQVEERFKKDSDEIEQSHRNFQSNTEKHFTFTEKKESLKNLLKLKKAKEDAFEMRLKSETALRFQKVKEQEKRLEDVRESFFLTELEIHAINGKKNQLKIEITNKEIENMLRKFSDEKKAYKTSKSIVKNLETELETLDALIAELEKPYKELGEKKSKIESVENWLKGYLSIENIETKFKTQSKYITQIEKLQSLNHFLKINELTTDFRNSEYSKSFKKAIEFYSKRKGEIKIEIEDIKKLQEIIKTQNPDSLAGWAVKEEIQLNELQESVLFHFATKPTKYDANDHYIPEPKGFIESLKNEVRKTETGFIINLSGLHYHIPQRENYVFGNPEKLKNEIVRIGNNYQLEVNKLKLELKTIEDLDKLFSEEINYSEEHLMAYLNQEELYSFKIDDSFKITSEQLDEKVSLFQIDNEQTEEEKVKTLYRIALEKYQEKLGVQLTSKEKKTSNTTLQGQALERAREIRDSFQIKIRQLIKLRVEKDSIETKFIAWKSGIEIELYEGKEIVENPFSKNQGELLKKITVKYNVVKEESELSQPLLSFTEKCGGLKNEIKGIKILIPVLQNQFNKQEKEYSSYFKKTFDNEELVQKISDDDLKKLQALQVETDTAYKSKYDLIVQTFQTDLNDNPKMRDHQYNFNQLIFELISPQLITNKEKPEESLMNDIENILADLKQKIQVLNEEETRKIHSTIHSLKDIVEKHISDLEKIQTHFKEFKLANHHSVTLEFGPADDFDLNWIKKFKNDSQDASFLKAFGFKTNESAHNILERIFKEYCPTVKDPKAYQILDPFNYYTAEAKLIDTTGIQKAATGGTGYGLLALIGIAKLSVVEGKRNIKDLKKGIRILPVDEVAGLGGNFEMLYELAKVLDYQIFTMTISANDLNFQDGNQIYYEFIGSANPEKPYLNEGVHACFSKVNTTFDIERYFSDKIFRLPNEIDNVI